MLLALFLSLTAALGIAAAVNTPPTLMSRADYLKASRAIQDIGRLSLARCRELEPEQRAVCRAQARAGERIAVADLDIRYLGTVSAQQQARAVQARAARSIEQARRLAAT